MRRVLSLILHVLVQLLTCQKQFKESAKSFVSRPGVEEFDPAAVHDTKDITDES